MERRRRRRRRRRSGTSSINSWAWLLPFLALNCFVLSHRVFVVLSLCFLYCFYYLVHGFGTVPSFFFVFFCFLFMSCSFSFQCARYGIELFFVFDFFSRIFQSSGGLVKKWKKYVLFSCRVFIFFMHQVHTTFTFFCVSFFFVPFFFFFFFSRRCWSWQSSTPA